MVYMYLHAVRLYVSSFIPGAMETLTPFVVPTGLDTPSVSHTDCRTAHCMPAHTSASLKAVHECGILREEGGG